MVELVRNRGQIEKCGVALVGRGEAEKECLQVSTSPPIFAIPFFYTTKYIFNRDNEVTKQRYYELL